MNNIIHIDEKELIKFKNSILLSVTNTLAKLNSYEITNELTISVPYKEITDVCIMLQLFPTVLINIIKDYINDTITLKYNIESEFDWFGYIVRLTIDYHLFGDICFDKINCHYGDNISLVPAGTNHIHLTDRLGYFSFLNEWIPNGPLNVIIDDHAKFFNYYMENKFNKSNYLCLSYYYKNTTEKNGVWYSEHKTLVKYPDYRKNKHIKYTIQRTITNELHLLINVTLIRTIQQEIDTKITPLIYDMLDQL